MIEVLQQLINEVARFVGRCGVTISAGFNPEHCPYCDHRDPLDDETVESGGADGRGT